MKLIGAYTLRATPPAPSKRFHIDLDMRFVPRKGDSLAFPGEPGSAAGPSLFTVRDVTVTYTPETQAIVGILLDLGDGYREPPKGFAEVP